MTAETIATALGGRTVGGCWMAHCPAHDDQKPSLSISAGDQGNTLVYCHAGCDQVQVIAALRELGLWRGNGTRRPRRIVRRPVPCTPDKHHDANRTKAALDIWRASRPATGTLAEAYLHIRGLTQQLPPALRFHPGLTHPAGGVWPAMVALVTRGTDDTPMAIHRTFLARDGAGKAPVKPERMMLGPCRGGVVRLASSENALMVGEGIETCLAAMQATGRPAWAALSTSGLRALDLSDDVREVIVLADGDDPGEAAARETAHRWKREGRRVRIAWPPRGADFNDLLLGRVLRNEESAA